MLAIALLACGPLYGADFGFPADVPVPDSAVVVLHDQGADDDDPLRSRQQVIDVATSSPTAAFDFYRTAYPASEGWRTRKDGTTGELCLVNRSRSHYTEVLDVSPYAGTRVATRPGRYLVATAGSRTSPRRPATRLRAGPPRTSCSGLHRSPTPGIPLPHGSPRPSYPF